MDGSGEKIGVVDRLRPHTRTIVETALVALAAIAISMIRRPNQIDHPAIWVEEGTQFIRQYLDSGWRFIFEPVNGYLIAPAKLNAWIAWHLGFESYPVWSYVLALLSAAIVAVAILRAPTLIPFKPAAALLPFLIPFDPETVGINEYVFWFFGLFSVLALFWQHSRTPYTRAAFAIIGGISGPLGVVLMPLFLIRTLWRFPRPENFMSSPAFSNVLTLGAAGLMACIQVALVILSKQNEANLLMALGNDPEATWKMLVERFVGHFFWAESAGLLIGLIALFFIVRWLIVDVKRGSYVALAFAVCFLVSVVISVMRAPLDMITAMGNGPRYFFYPYIFLGLLCLTLAREPKRQLAVGFGAFLMLANTMTFVSRPHDPLDWAGAARTCRDTPGRHLLPVHLNGMEGMKWQVDLSQDDCQILDRKSLFK